MQNPTGSAAGNKRLASLTLGLHVHVPIATTLTSCAAIRLELFAERNAIDVVLLRDGGNGARKHVGDVARLLIVVHVLAGRMHKAAIFAKAALILNQNL